MDKAIAQWESELITSGVVNIHQIRLADQQKIAMDLATNHLQYRLVVPTNKQIDKVIFHPQIQA